MLIFLTSCIFPGVYKLDIPQGNVIEEGKIDQLKIGMNKRQVRYLLGTPLLIDTFNQDRWDYYFSLKSREGDFVEQRMTLYFVKGKLNKIDKHLLNEETDLTPAEN